MQLHVAFHLAGHQPLLSRAIRDAAEALFSFTSFHSPGVALMPTMSKAGRSKESPGEVFAGSLHAAGSGISQEAGSSQPSPLNLHIIRPESRRDVNASCKKSQSRRRRAYAQRQHVRQAEGSCAMPFQADQSEILPRDSSYLRTNLFSSIGFCGQPETRGSRIKGDLQKICAQCCRQRAMASAT